MNPHNKPLSDSIRNFCGEIPVNPPIFHRPDGAPERHPEASR